MLLCFFGSRAGSRKKKINAWYIYLTSRQPPPNLHNLTSALTCHVISQSAFTRRESNFGGNNVSFEINFREKKIFKYVHVQMALPKKRFCDEMELPYLYLTATNNKEFTGKSSLTSFCAESSEKKKKNRLKHRISRTGKCRQSEDRSE